MKKNPTPPQIFQQQLQADEGVTGGIDAIVQQLADSGATGEEIDRVYAYFNQQLETLAPYRKYMATRPEEASKHGYDLEIVIEKGKSRRKEKMRFPNPIRLAISVLMITLGFAMIILPAPPYFEMYTIFYFNESDGFTLMDLISLIIVFCGIFTLIMTLSKRRREE